MKKALRFLQTLFLIYALSIPQSLWAETEADTAPQDSKTSPQSTTDDKGTSDEVPEEKMTEEQKNKKEEIEQMHQTLEMIRSVQNTTQTLRAAKVKVPKRS